MLSLLPIFIIVLKTQEGTSQVCRRSSGCGGGCYCQEVYNGIGQCTCSYSGGSSHHYSNTFLSWGEWTTCSVTCGNGSQQRHRSCDGSCSGSSSQSRTCHPGPCPVNGSWSSWGNYSPCDKTCGNGWKVRFRKCSNPQPAYGGLSCIGDSLEAVRCNTFHCPVDGQWSAWSGYGQCSSSCGAGIQIRIRNCSNPAPEYGGNNCSGSFKESQPCNLRHCPVNGNWGQWGHFRPCDMPCGGGIHIRMRGCDDPLPSYGGLQCPGQSVQTEACNTQSCQDIKLVTLSNNLLG
ncbi:coadhesin-like [Saccostrea cucullata]|uniref:coadhesin-like n=1 Tax=Saccostrea cuccullata TaxID=36930 RepID=UPI002ED12057